ncbi:hypothetical protein OHB41_33925 [Streptomyces sp. NBC_01571]|uniref:hypothetical protein n=1 Tax=Streptomyces sp. NBC_01571 TaxID=2975883 RepID=UPI00225A8917|nr:hypothetical protein [Streptomyces sp. NBC_01571]MCX4578101.1 hypothetical protein [Streptomyces sp. NBC_01571]
MDDDTQTEAAPTTPTGANRRCDWHKGPSSTAVIVDAIERNSAPPVPLWACAPCREQRHLIPLADRT